MKCLSCSDISNCVNCDSQLANCLKCDIGYYVSSGICVKCNIGCISCSNNKTCLKAGAGYYVGTLNGE